MAHGVNKMQSFPPWQRTEFSCTSKFSISLLLQKGIKQSSLKYLVTPGQNIISRPRWPSGQIRSQWVCVVGLAAHCVTLFPGVIIFWVTSKHLIESFQGYKLTENYFLLLIPAWSSKYSKQPALLETGQEFCNFWVVTEEGWGTGI